MRHVWELLLSLNAARLANKHASARVNCHLMTSPDSSPRKSPRRRRTIALLLDYVDFVSGGWETQLRQLFHEACQALDINLLVVVGQTLDDPNPAAATQNVIYDHLRGARVDGAVLVSATLASYGGVDRVQALCERLRPTRLVSMGLELEGVPSLVVDNRRGLRQLVEHLIRDHGCRRLAFIGGKPRNEEARVRREVFRQTLYEHGLEFDQRLVVGGDFVWPGGYRAMETLLERELPFDGVVAANDGMALGAIAALRANGHRVPRDVPVTGFDDLAVARLGVPPLTTVAQPFQELAQLSIQRVVDQLDGREVSLLTELDACFVARESCGCNHRQQLSTVPPRRGEAREVVEYIREHRERLSNILSSASYSSRSGLARYATVLVDALEETLDSHGSAAFLDRIEALLESGEIATADYQDVQTAISRLRDALNVVSTPQLEDLWHDARTLVGLASARVHSLQSFEFDETGFALVQRGEQISRARDLDSLHEILADVLPEPGLQNAYISLCVDDDPRLLTPWLCLLDGASVSVPPEAFVSSDLFFEGGYADRGRHTSIVLPLGYETVHRGVGVFECRDGFNGYQLLRDQLSGGLYRVALHAELVRQTMLRERSVQERLATARRMESLSMLAGGVAHDLNNSLAPLLALPEVMLTDIASLAETTGADVAELRADVESIRSVALRASQTIKDLLTLGRQGKTHREPRDLNEIVRGMYDQASARRFVDEHRTVTVRLELEAGPLPLLASEAHLGRALTNLVRNAAESMVGEGSILIKTSEVSQPEPGYGYEALPPGEYIMLEVSDSGAGIPESLLSRVFEPFFTNKKTGEQSGSGLGLAIVHSVVKEHGGFLDVESHLGQGTTFRLYFPRSNEDHKSGARVSDRPLGQGHLLVIGADGIQMRTAARVLGDLGYEVETLDPILDNESLTRLVSGAVDDADLLFDVIVVDADLGGAHDGISVLTRILDRRPTQQAVFVAPSPPSQPPDSHWPRQVTWLAKPYTGGALARAVKEALLRRQTLPAFVPGSRVG